MSEEASGRDWARLAFFPSPEAAQLLAGRLESEGIRAVVLDAVSDDPYRGVTGMVGAGVQVLVPKDRLAEAEAVLRSIEDD